MVARFARISLLSLSLLMGLPVAAQAGDITAYTSLEEDDAKVYIEAFNKEHPDIKVHLLRLSTGDLGARILAEANNPQHDVIWGWAVTNMVDPRIQAMLEAYSPDGVDKVDKHFRDPEGRWFATTGYFAAFCVNKTLAEAKKLPIPSSWEDLLNPAYKGEIVMPNAASSGTGYLQVSSLLQMKGEEAGWKYLKQLDQNVAQYIKSGSKPCRMASAGEYVIGTSFAFAAVKQISEGFPITMIIPKEGAGYEVETSGLMKTSQNKEDAKKFLSWLLTPAAAKLYGERAEMNSVPGGEQAQIARDAGMPADVTKVLFNMDFAWSASNKDRILKQWQADIER
ncbi:MAG: ABC transporter substrate-binding protein [Parvibaculaceae bacterium]